MGDSKSLAHTKWNCKYHIVFAPKYRRQVFYGEKKRLYTKDGGKAHFLEFSDT
ncbi:MAG: transposase, partial [Desulfovibrionaceae bacterium]